jgi:uncharacterized membrane protein YebE (DUF533 family)
MANLGGILGAMMATGMAGRSRLGPRFGASPFGMMGGGGMMGARRGGGMKQAAGLAALGYLAYKAYGEYKKNNPQAGLGRSAGAGQGAGQDRGASPPVGGLLGRALGALAGGTDERGAGPSSGLGERLASLLRPEDQARPEQAIGDPKALLLIRAMVAAANADGQIDSGERQAILARLEEAGASADDRQFVEAELAAPKPIDSLLADVRDEETAEQVYVASALAVGEGSPSENTYLQYLAARLNMDAERMQDLQKGLTQV